MALIDPRTEKSISPLVPSQFPAFVQATAPVLVDFVQAFYRWMESVSEGPLYHNRRILDYNDIDLTTSQFLVHFRQKYTPGIKLETAFNPRLLVKHALDLYRSRGTTQAIDLFFRLVYGVGAKVYFPGRDLFRASDGEWIIPLYLEVTTRLDIAKFIGLDIVGSISGAEAFVERTVRKLAGTHYVNLMFISGVIGDFVPGEIVNAKLSPFPSAACPTVIGSLTSLEVEDGGTGFAVGEIVNVVSTTGVQGTARVANVSSLAGVVAYDLVDGGYGFTVNSPVLVSESVLTVANVHVAANNNTLWYFYVFDTISQPLANLNYVNITGGNFVSNSFIFTYYANSTLKGSGYVLSVLQTNSSAGELFISVRGGSMNDNAIYNTGNTVSANLPVVNGYIDLTASANVFAESDNVVVSYDTPLNGNFQVGEEIFQVNSVTSVTQANGTLFALDSTSQLLTLVNTVGIFHNAANVTGRISGAVGNVTGKQFQIGVLTVNNGFLIDSRAPWSANISGSNGIIENISQGTGASVSVSPDLLYPEEVFLNTDYVNAYVAVPLNSGHYGFPSFPNANLATPLINALAYVTTNIGTIQFLTGQNPGQGYSAPPFVRAYEPLTFPYHQPDYLCTITGLSTSFSPGELVLQAATGARGLVLQSNSTSLEMRRLNLVISFVPTTNSTLVIVGQSSGATANIVAVGVDTTWKPEDIFQPFLGFDAQIDTTATTANGSVTELQVIDSGFGYTDGQDVTFTYPGAEAGVARIVLGKQGMGAGYYRSEGGEPSGIKHLQDGVYWQDFSYEVRTAISFDEYSRQLQDVLHVAGTKAFGALYKTSEVSLGITTEATVLQANSANGQLDFSRPQGSQYLILGVP